MTFIITSQQQLVRITPPRLPAAPTEYERRYHDQFADILRLYFNRLESILGQLNTGSGAIDGSGIRLPYGAFHDSTTQTQTAVNTAKAITFDATDYSNGVARGTPTSRIVVTYPGYYNFQFSTQLDKSSGAAASVWIWPRVNGANITHSASKVTIQGTAAESVPAWNFVLEMNANDYFELYWLTDDTNVQLKHEPGFGVAPNNVPEIPSVILTATFVSALPP
jgi:hypothetical protein